MVGSPTATPQPKCPKCDGLGWITADVEVGHPAFGKAFPCECIREELAQRRIARVLKDQGVPTLFHGLNFVTFDLLSGDEQAGKYLARDLAGEMASFGWCQMDGIKKPGLLLYGEPGRGKSGLAYAMIPQRIQAGQAVNKLDFSEFMERLRATYRGGAEEDAHTLLSAAAEAPFLIVDDLKAAHSLYTSETMFSLVKRRHEWQRSTVLTSNMSPEEIYRSYGEPFGRRLDDLCHAIAVGGLPLEAEADHD